ncbi:MAG TPA: FGGY family carbohydrate kinase, partial [Prolixibacteraceae bacterium]|nr:FGGY family carbohydrate kinase [Prolixibacteraceae bacterium]
LSELYATSGVYPYALNTINKMIWFRENRPDVLENAHRFLFIPSLLINKLSGAFKNDTTMMGTAMMADLKSRKMSPKILKAIGIEEEMFGEIGEPGSQAGAITENAASETGLPKGTQVFLTGHDTQFAIFGSGAKLNQPVLSSGTWEVLMARSEDFNASEFALDKKITTEADAEAGVYDIGQNWLGSGVLEWFSRHFYATLSGNELYQKMINDAENEQPGANGIFVDPAFYDDGTGSEGGMIKGLTIGTTRGQVYRAFLEGLAYRLREGLDALEKAGSFKAESIICVGGGSKNRLWNQLRADVCKVPVQLIDQKETTVLGASMFVLTAAGVFGSLNEAREQINYNPQFVEPSINSEAYEGYYQNYLKLRPGKK